MSGWSSRMGVRARLWLAVLATVAVALASVTVAFNLYLADSLNSDADKRLSTMTADASGAIIQTDAGYSFPVSTGDIKGLGSQVWVYVRGYTLAAPDLDPALGEAAKALYGQPAQYVDLPEQQVRMFCVPLYDSKGEELIGTIVAAVDMGPYSSTQRLALLATSALTAILLIIVGFAARWVLNAAFRPVSRMTAEAEAW
jgi:two-component system OmpR family sensor kinase